MATTAPVHFGLGLPLIPLQDESLNPFIWLRRKAAEAVVLGTGDGLRAVTPEGELPPSDLGDLRALLASATIDVKALGAAVAEEKSATDEAAGKRKSR